MNQASNFQQLWLQLQPPFQANPISISFCIFFIFFLLLVKHLISKKQSPNIPPSPPKLPIIGNLHQLGALPHQSLASLSNKYGPIMLLKLGQIPTLVVSSSNMAREIMKTHDPKFSNRPKTIVANLLFYGCQDVGFSPYGEYWRQAKKMCVLELFTLKRVESFQYVRDEEVDVVLNRIRKAANCSLEGVNLSQLFLQISNNIVSRCVMGMKFEDENGKSKYGELSRRMMDLFSMFCVGDFFPSFGWVDVVRGVVGEMKRTCKKMDEIYDMVFEEHITKLRNGESDDHRKDFVDIMLQLNNQDDMLDYHFTRDNLKAIIQDMFAGGSDTTATALEWTMAELIRSPNTMKKVQEEIRTIVGKNKAKKIEMNDIKKMEYMKCVIKESLRLHPPIPLLVPRQTSDMVNIEGYHVASGTSVFVNVWAIQRDPKIWERPDQFIPERFMKEKKSIDFKGLDFELVPFGSGRRKCPGLEFGIASFECVLANLLYWFDWKLPEDTKGELLDMTELNGITVRKKIPLHLIPLPYNYVE